MSVVAAWVSVFGALVCITYGHVIMKWRMDGRNLPDGLFDKIVTLVMFLFEPWVFSAVAMTFLGSLMWMAALTRLPLNQAFPFTAVPFVTVTVLATVLFNETASPQRLFGVALIVSGMVLAARG